MSGARPPLSNDDCSDGLKNLIIRCWHPQPEVRLSFSGNEAAHISSGCPLIDYAVSGLNLRLLFFLEIVTMVEGIKVQTVTPVSSTAPTDDGLSHHNDQPDQSVSGKLDEHSPINVSVD